VVCVTVELDVLKNMWPHVFLTADEWLFVRSLFFFFPVSILCRDSSTVVVLWFLSIPGVSTGDHFLAIFVLLVCCSCRSNIFV